MTCPHCRKRIDIEHLKTHLTPQDIKTLWGYYCLSQRKTPPKAGPGRPRKQKP